ncbi:5-formyltetrahydrofolate cyclo-ligase, partial [bacterium]|nr:5-formyltetrahydrofolate cyclo-ligase [bacterium]
GDTLNESPFKTKEPQTKPENPDIIDLIILPALAADKNNFRLGYGKGYYDRLLSKTTAKTILPIAKELVFENLPVESHDKQVDIVITD